MLTSGHMRADLNVILPILIVAGTACVMVLGEAPVVRAVWRRIRGIDAAVSLAGLLGALYVLLGRLPFSETRTAFAGAVAGDSLFGATSIALAVTGILSVLMAWTYLSNRGLEHGEYYVLLLFSISGAMLMAAARDLIVLFLGLEVLSFALYVLAGFARTAERSEEASIKYFLLGAFASAFFLYGIALIYGATRTTDLGAVTAAVMAGARTPMLLGGIAMIIVGLGFKAAVVPFHQWTPDVYEGAPTSVTAYMAGGAKIGAFAAMLRVFTALLPVHAAWLTPIQVLAILTMIFGNLLAIQQTNVKRLLAYSSIAHAGYLLVAVAAMAHKGLSVAGSVAYDSAVSAAVFYLFAYVFMTLGAFGVLVYLSSRDRDYQTLNDLRGLARQDPVAAYTMLFFMLSLGGIPPTMGFFGKWMIFLAALKAGEVTLAIVMALTSAAAVYYYLKIVWMMAFDEPRTTAPSTVPTGRAGATASVMLAATGTILFGLFPFLLTPIIEVLR